MTTGDTLNSNELYDHYLACRELAMSEPDDVSLTHPSHGRLYWSAEASNKLRKAKRAAAFGVPHPDTIRDLATASADKPLLEIGAGLGYWAFCVGRAGGRVVATDKCHPKDNEFFDEDRPIESFVEIEVATAKQALRKYPDLDVLWVWPRFDTTIVSGLQKLLTGRTIHYVGEGYWGCCISRDDSHYLQKNGWDHEDIREEPDDPFIHSAYTIYRESQ